MPRRTANGLKRSSKANTLLKTGWDVHIADSDGRRYGPKSFNEVL